MPSLPFAVDFAVSPRFEVFYALYTLSNPAPSSLDEWKDRALLRLPRDFEKSARKVAPTPLFWPLLADALQATPGELTFEGMLAHLGTLAPSELRASVLSGIFHDERTVDALVSGEKSLREVVSDDKLPGAELLAHFGLRSSGASNSDSSRAISTLLTDPDAFRKELVLVLETFWETGFRRDWSALVPRLRQDAARLRKRFEDTRPEQLATDLKLPFAIDGKSRSIRTKAGSLIPFRSVERFYVLPSAFNTHRWWAKYENKAGAVYVYLPIAGGSASANAIADDSPLLQAATSDTRAAIQPEAVFRALGDTTRYAIASVLARTPTTSADLARTLKVSKPTITHHVQALRAAGLITEVADAGSSRLALNAETVRGLSAAAVDHLFASTGDLSLETTRKKRK